jgi:hypothetical protein
MIVISPIFLQSISTSMHLTPQHLFTANCSVDDRPLRGRRTGIPGVVTELRFYYRYHTNQLLNAVIAVFARMYFKSDFMNIWRVNPVLSS